MKTDNVISSIDSSQVFHHEMRQIIIASYDKHNLDHLSFCFCSHRKNLSETCFNSYIIRLVSHCEINSVIINADIQELFSLLKQMTECISSKNDDNLIT